MNQRFFMEAFDFLSEFSWIYRTSNTEFLAKEVLDRLPIDWVEYFAENNIDKLNALTEGASKWSNMPPSLQEFLERLQNLRDKMVFLPYENTPSTKSLQSFKGISQKKQHEIDRLSTELGNVIQSRQSDPNIILVDLGSGLGYLSQHIHRQFGWRVLGLEGDASRVAAALKRQATFYPDSVAHVRYTQHFVHDPCETAELIRQECRSFFNLVAEVPFTIAIIGLHACAALSITASKLFLHMPEARILSIMPCCYHKMCAPRTLADFELRARPDCIPLSADMQHSHSASQWHDRVVNVPFLRLAAQQCASRWRETTTAQHLEHGAAMWDRAVLQAVLADGESLVRSARCSGTVGGGGDDYNTDDDVRNEWPLLRKCTLMTRNGAGELVANRWTAEHSQRAERLRERYPNGVLQSELLTGLQAAIQSLCEYVVLFDRVCFLNENLPTDDAPTNRPSLRKIVCDNLSPRSFLLVAEK